MDFSVAWFCECGKASNCLIINLLESHVVALITKIYSNDL